LNTRRIVGAGIGGAEPPQLRLMAVPEPPENVNMYKFITVSAKAEVSPLE
jgi:hypothetical protein